MPKTITRLRDLTPDQGNANKHTPRGTSMMETSIREVGFGDSLTVDRNGVVISGNQRLETLADVGLDDPIVVQTDGRRPVVHQRVDLEASDPRAKRLALFSNRVGQVNLDWDADALRRLQEDDVSLDGLWGDDELADLFGTASPAEGLTDPDVVPEPRPTSIQRGDVFALGPHRLLCGDSTNIADVGRVMDGDRADLCLTDPPYGIGEHYEGTDDSEQNLAALVAGFLPLAREASRVVLLTPSNKNQRFYPHPEWTLCWFVPAGIGRGPWGFTCWQPVLAYGRDPYLAEGLGSRPDGLNQTEAAENTLGHPCPKPVGVWSWFMERGSVRSGQLVFDPFCGSGTTLIAAEKLRRRVKAIELIPSYCQVIIDRWEAFTGQKAVKL